MEEQQKTEILERAKAWMRDELVPAHLRNTLKLSNVDALTINPFLWKYLARFLHGNSDAKSLASVLVLPRILGTSINTSFGQRSQSLVTRLFDGTFGSSIPGMDIEFTDKIDGRRKYCQVKAGPNVINHDDVATISGHFKSMINLARTNQMRVEHNDLMFCLLYGTEDQKNSYIKDLEKDYFVTMGQDFWLRLTGDAEFYASLITAMSEVADEVDNKEVVNTVIEELARDIQKKHPELFVS